MTRFICIFGIALTVCWASWHLLSTTLVAFTFWDISIMYDIACWDPVGRAFYGGLGILWLCFAIQPIGDFVADVWDEYL